MGLKKKSKNPAVFSHEYLIQNHADVFSSLALLIAVGLMFRATSSISAMFVALQYNITVADESGVEKIVGYGSGPKDSATVVFYSLLVVVVHAILQEYGFDKLNRRLHLSKVKQNRLSESGQLLALCAASLCGAVFCLPEGLWSRPAVLWEGFPHSIMPFPVKLYFICQLAYWLHAVPELYLQRVRKEDILVQVQHISLYMCHILGAYVLNLTRLGVVLLCLHYAPELLFHSARLVHYLSGKAHRLFQLWVVVFVTVRLLSMTLAVLTILSLSTAPLLLRALVLGIVCLTQAWLLWHFLRLQISHWREARWAAAPVSTNATHAKQRPARKDGKSHNGTARVEPANQLKKIKAR
uniref:translocating chain-associated membrane protein 1-like n=1 Tax=Myxine glutinosa TaxID=7769 RepID=UPI00358F110B